MTTASTDERPPALRDQVADEVRAWLARRRISGAELARRAGRSQTFIAKRLDGRQALDMDDLELIARILNVDPGVFIPHDRVAATRRYPTRNDEAIATLALAS